MSREKYQAYLASREWGLKREAVKKRAANLCERCQWRMGIAVHHKTYARVYREPLADLILLCDVCHALQHGRDHEIDIAAIKAEAQKWLRELDAAKQASGLINITAGFAELAAHADCNNPMWRTQKRKHK